MLDPIFGELQNPVNKAPEPRQSKIYSKTIIGSSFATAVASMSEQTKVQSQPNEQSSNVTSSSAFTKPCMFCNRNHPMHLCETFQNKPNNDKVEFFKDKGLCFGCLQKGHISKNCQRRLSCNICKQNHPTILHIQVKGNQSKSQSETKAFTSSANSGAVLSLATGSNTGAGKKECALAIIPVKVKWDKGTNCVETYAFLDPGSSATFCTEDLAKQLSAPVKRTEILLKTMGQEKTLSTFRIAGLEVAALDSNTFLKLPNVFTQKEIPVTHDDIPK